MALGDITINDGQGTPVAHTFVYVATNGGKVVRRDMSAATETPLQMIVGHADSKKGSVEFQSHLVRFDIAILDADGVTVYPSNVRVMVDVPKKVASDALADDCAAYIRNFLSSANMRLLFKGSVF